MGPEVALVRPEVNSMVPEITKNAKAVILEYSSKFVRLYVWPIIINKKYRK